MADTKISDLTVETTPPAATDHYVAAETDTTNTAVPASMVTLEHDTASPVGSNVTAAIGKWYSLDLSGLTAARLFVLPDSVAVGSIIGFRVDVAAPSTLANILKVATAASGSLLEGVDASAGSDKYCVFIAGECMRFRCVKNGGAGDTDWAVEVDGRRPSYCRIRRDTSNQSISDATWTAAQLNAVASDPHDLADATNYRIYFRRNGAYLLSMSGLFDSGTGTARLKVDGDSTWNIVLSPKMYMTGDNLGANGSGTFNVDLSVDTYISLTVLQSTGGAIGLVNSASSHLEITEIL